MKVSHNDFLVLHCAVSKCVRTFHLIPRARGVYYRLRTGGGTGTVTRLTADEARFPADSQTVVLVGDGDRDTLRLIDGEALSLSAARVKSLVGHARTIFKITATEADLER